MFFPELILAAEVLSIEALFVKIATSITGTGVAAFALYIIYKMHLSRQAKKNGNDNAKQPSSGNPLSILGGSNPAGGETPPVMFDPLKQPITHGEHETICSARQNVIDTKLDNISKGLADSGARISSVETELRSNTVTMNNAVNRLDKAVAVLEDRTNHGR